MRYYLFLSLTVLLLSFFCVSLFSSRRSGIPQAILLSLSGVHSLLLALELAGPVLLSSKVRELYALHDGCADGFEVSEFVE